MVVLHFISTDHETAEPRIARCNEDIVNCMYQNEDMAIISAQQYYVDYGLDLNVDRLTSLMPSYLPDSYLETQKDASYWIQVQHLYDAGMNVCF